MRILTGAFPKIEGGCVVAMGTFDGVHLGHRAVISRAVEIAQKMSYPSCVWCFDIPPRVLFTGENVELITTHKEKSALISSLGVDIMVRIAPTKELLSMSPDEFLKALFDALSPAHIVTGFNFTFGAGARGNVDTLTAYAARRGVGTTTIGSVTAPDGKTVSSTLIRETIRRGEVSEIRAYLGRNFTVEPIYKDGRAYLPDRVVVPPKGKYEALVYFLGGKGNSSEIITVSDDGEVNVNPERLTAAKPEKIEFLRRMSD